MKRLVLTLFLLAFALGVNAFLVSFFKCSFKKLLSVSVFRIINTPLDQDWVRKISLFSVLIFFFSTGILFGQNQPSLLDLRTCGKSCSSGNYTIKRVFLSDEFGNELTVCNNSGPVDAYISIIYSTNS
jgi:hypothetical protein